MIHTLCVTRQYMDGGRTYTRVCVHIVGIYVPNCGQYCTAALMDMDIVFCAPYAQFSREVEKLV